MAETKMKFTEKILHVQTELKAPKNLRNNFGGYNYRNAEGILEAVKPLLNKYGLILLIGDDIIEVNGKTYVKASAQLWDAEDTNSKLAACAYAREAETKKGMDDSQITGCASSYARKYALNGLFLLDDTKDADTDEYHEETEKKAKKSETKTAAAPATTQVISDEMYRSFMEYVEKSGCGLARVLSTYGVKKAEELTEEQYNDAMTKMEAVIKKKEAK